jgi:hypothetical protein
MKKWRKKGSFLLCRKPKSAGPKPHIVPSGNPDSKGR